MKLIPKYKGGFKIVRKIVKKLSDLINKMEPTQIMVIGFAIIILIGAILLNMPISTQNGESIGFLDALFTSTSAVCSYNQENNKPKGKTFNTRIFESNRFIRIS